MLGVCGPLTDLWTGTSLRGYVGCVSVFSFIRRAWHLRHRWSAMVVCEGEHSSMCFPTYYPS